jgi:hypothetical protein
MDNPECELALLRMDLRVPLTFGDWKFENLAKIEFESDDQVQLMYRDYYGNFKGA